MAEGYIGISRSSAVVLAEYSVGTWERDLVTERVYGDAVFARLFGFMPDEAAHGIPVTRFVEAFHPDDRGIIANRQREAVEVGGLFVLEYRTVPAQGDVRWVLSRGHFERDADGRVVRCRGICIDATGSRSDGHVSGRLRVNVPDGQDECPLDRFAGLALAAWDALARLNVDDTAALEPLVRALLNETGRRVAADLNLSALVPARAKPH